MGKLIDLTGKNFGDFKITSFDDTKGKYKYYWNGECIHCCNKKSIASSRLHNNEQIRCDVCNKDFGKSTVKGYAEDLTGQQFGELTVSGFAFNKYDHSHWYCTCSCGNEIIKSITFLRFAKERMCDECKYRIKQEAINALNECKRNEKKEKPVVRGRKHNVYEFVDDYVIINGNIFIDAIDFEKIDSFDRYISVNSGGYPYFTYYEDEIFLNRLIVGLPPTFTEEDGRIAEHIDGNRKNNRRNNLRICQKSLNPINVGLYSNNTTGHKGITWNKRLCKYQVNIQKDKVNHYLGVYSNIDDAIMVRNEAERELFGEFARAKEHLRNTNGNAVDTKQNDLGVG